MPTFPKVLNILGMCNNYKVKQVWIREHRQESPISKKNIFKKVAGGFKHNLIIDAFFIFFFNSLAESVEYMSLFLTKSPIVSYV